MTAFLFSLHSYSLEGVVLKLFVQKASTPGESIEGPYRKCVDLKFVVLFHWIHLGFGCLSA